MRYLCAILLAAISYVAFAEPPVQTEQKSPAHKKIRPAKQQRDELLDVCHGAVRKMDAHVPEAVVKRYCRCFILGAETKHLSNLQGATEEQLMRELGPLVERCYKRHVSPWYMKRIPRDLERAPKSPLPPPSPPPTRKGFAA